MKSSRLKGGAMVYAVFIAVIIALISFMMINLAFLNRSIFDENEGRVKLIQNSISGIHYLLANQDSSLTEEIEINTHTRDSVLVSKENWGMYQLLKAKAHKGKNHTTQIALSGTQLDSNNRVGLYLSKENYTLKITGSTKLYGRIIIPNSKVERAYIEGKNYNGNKLVYGQVGASKNSIPRITIPEIGIEKSDSVVPFYIQDRINYSHPFAKSQPLVLYSDSLIQLDSVRMNGYIKVVSAVGIEIGNQSILENPLLLAPYVRIKDGSKGTCQAFATDSIVLDSSQLDYPSSLVLIPDKTATEYKGISIEGGSMVKGDLICQTLANQKSLATIHIAKDSKVYGQVYSTAYAYIRGTVNGSVVCKNIILDTKTSTYNNHLMDAVIDPRKLSVQYCGLQIYNQLNSHKAIVKWLE